MIDVWTPLPKSSSVDGRFTSQILNVMANEQAAISSADSHVMLPECNMRLATLDALATEISSATQLGLST